MKWTIKNENKGFTLIELILSVVILALVAAIMYEAVVLLEKIILRTKKFG